jgi:hypothetical protein
MKVIFSDSVYYNTVTDSELADAFATDSNVQVDQTTGGRYIETAQYFGLPGSVGARRDGDYIPEPANPIFVNARDYLRKVMGVIGMSGDVMRRVRTNEGAFLDYSEQALPDLVLRLQHELDRMLIGNGLAIKARCDGIPVNVTPGVYTIVLKVGFGVAGYTGAHKLFAAGETIVFSDTADGTTLKTGGGNDQMARVTAVLPADNTILVEMSAALFAVIEDADYIFPGDKAGTSANQGGANREPDGLMAAVDDGSQVPLYKNLDRTSDANVLWRGQVIDASVAPYSGAFTEDLLIYGDDLVMEYGAGKSNFIVAPRQALRAYWSDLKSDRRLVNPTNYVGGKMALQVNLTDRQIGLKASRKLSNQAFQLQLDTFVRHTLNTFVWDDTTGAIWNRVTDANGRKDEFYAVGYMYENLFCKAPAKNIRYEKLTV